MATEHWFIKVSTLVYHEIFHYAAARLLGIRATLKWDSVSYQLAKPDWRYVPVSLAPALAAWLISVRLLGMALARSDTFAFILCIVFTVLYQMTCVIDYYDAYYFIRHRAYPPEERGLPALPVISQRWWDSRTK